jgi:putative ABC transport system permease protein
VLWSLAFKEIKRNKTFTTLFLVNVMVGLLGLVLIENFKVSFQSVLDARAKNLLGADISLSSRFPIDKAKKKVFVEKVAGLESTTTDLMTMFSMARSEKSSRLVFLNTMKLGKTSETTYPFYGQLEIDGKKSFPRPFFKLPEKGSVWVYPEVISQLGAGPLKIGSKSFKVAGVITDDSQQTFEMGSVAPKVFIRHDDVKEAGLIQKGSTVRYYTIIKSSADITKGLIEEGTKIIDDNAVRISTPNKSSEQVGRILAYLSDFLGLVSLVALFLASVGLFYLYRSHLSSKRVNFAILSSVGLSRREIFGLYIRHIIILGFLGSLLGLLASSLIIPIVNQFLSYVLPFELPVLMSPRAFGIGFLVGNLGVFLLSYPLILGAVRLAPASLFQEVAEMRSVQVNASKIHFLPYFLFFSLMSIYASNSLKVGSTFLALFLGVALLAIPVCFLLLKFAQGLSMKAKARISFKLSMRYLNRYRISTVSIFLSLLLGSMLLNLVPMLQQSIQAEITLGESSKLPSLFLFDIQDEQVEDLRGFFKEKPLIGLSPFIRGRISKINDKDVVVETEDAVTREGQREQRFRNRGTNLSYRDELTESETIIEGKPFPGPYNEERDGIPLISIETRYAQRLGIVMGDVLEFSILGVPLVGKVHNIRKVRWTSFIPNFFLQFQSGVLDDAPKTWLASVPQMQKSEIMSLQNRLYEKFPNISAVDISRVVKKILDVMRQMGWALKAMSFLCLGVGFFVLYSLASHQMNARKLDMVLLKVIGMGEQQLRTMVVREFVGIGFFAAFLGASFGIVVSFIVTHLFFDGLWRISLFWPLGSIVVVCVLCYFTASMASARVLRVRASSFLS